MAYLDELSTPQPDGKVITMHLQKFTTVVAVLAATAGVAASAASADAATTPTVTPFPVISAADTGSGTLREEINAVNNDKSDPTTNTDVIQFKIGTGTGVHTIKLASALPVITRPGVQIDGYTQQSGAAPATDTAPAKLKIVLDANGQNNGLDLTGDDVDVSGLDIQNALTDGVLVEGARDVVAGNYIGIDVDGSAARPNSNGVTVQGSDDTVGGPDPANRNVISGNGRVEVWLNGGSGHLVQGNRIGTNPDGRSDLEPFNATGVDVSTASIDGSEIRDNLVSGEEIGIALRSDNNTVKHNNVGTDETGTTAVPNRLGIEDAGDGNLLGGPGDSDETWSRATHSTASSCTPATARSRAT